VAKYITIFSNNRKVIDKAFRYSDPSNIKQFRVLSDGGVSALLKGSSGLHSIIIRPGFVQCSCSGYLINKGRVVCSHLLALVLWISLHRDEKLALNCLSWMCEVMVRSYEQGAG